MKALLSTNGGLKGGGEKSGEGQDEEGKEREGREEEKEEEEDEEREEQEEREEDESPMDLLSSIMVIPKTLIRSKTVVGQTSKLTLSHVYHHRGAYDTYDSVSDQSRSEIGTNSGSDRDSDRGGEVVARHSNGSSLQHSPLRSGGGGEREEEEQHSGRRRVEHLRLGDSNSESGGGQGFVVR